MDILAAQPEVEHEINRRLLTAPLVMLRPGTTYKPPVKAMVCADGFSVFVQAHHGAYCYPRSNEGPWTQFELGYPSRPMPEMGEWIDGADINDTQTVWGFVPIEQVSALIVRHGGLVREWSPR
jgi:hypothetical protein